MTSPLEPSPSGDAAAVLAVQVAALRGQVRLIFARLDKAGITGDLNLADQFAELARAVTQALDSPPRGPAAPYWIGLDPADHARQLTELRQWTDTVLRREYGGYQLRGCRANHPHAIWELSTPAAEWHSTYSRNQPDLDRALESHDRWLPATCAESATSPAGATPNAPPGGQRRRQPTDSRPSLSSRHRLRERTRAMTTVKLTPAELRLLDIQKARGIPYPDDIFAWREANAAAIAALEVRAEPAVREAKAGP
jgi:hypothetical protein